MTVPSHSGNRGPDAGCSVDVAVGAPLERVGCMPDAGATGSGGGPATVAGPRRRRLAAGPCARARVTACST